MLLRNVAIEGPRLFQAYFFRAHVSKYFYTFSFFFTTLRARNTAAIVFHVGQPANLCKWAATQEDEKRPL